MWPTILFVILFGTESGICGELSILPPHICDLIRAVPLSFNTGLEDFIRWYPNKNGEFSIKTAYYHLLHSLDYATSSISSFNWRMIWKIKIPFKYTMLIWNCCNEILPVAKSLNSKIDCISPTYSRCSATDEDHIHLFRDCWESSILWNYIFGRLAKNYGINLRSFLNLPWIDWISFNLNQSEKWKAIFCIAIWHIWKSSQAVVKQKMVKQFSVYSAFYVDYITTNKILQGKDKGKTKIVPAIWIPPAYDYLNLNTDGSWKAHNEGGGMVVEFSQVQQASGIWDSRVNSMLLLPFQQNFML